MMLDQTSAARSRANYFSERTYIKTNPTTGVARNRAGTRIISLSSDFLIGLRNALTFECGKAADAVMKTSGKRWGKKFAERLNNELSDYHGSPLTGMPMAMFEACMIEAFSHHGWGKLKPDFSHYDNGLLVFRVKCALYSTLVGKADAPVDPLLAGILGGMFSYFSGQTLDGVQTQCSACGAEESIFVVGLPERLEPVDAWVAAGKSHDDIFESLKTSTIES